MYKYKKKSLIPTFSRLAVTLCILVFWGLSINQTQANDQGGFHGQHTTHYPNGQLWYSINYVKGKREGAELTYFESGKIKERKLFVDNKAEGESVSYYENGKPHTKSFYSNGKLEGEQITYHENGKVAVSEHYRNGVKDGLRKAYNDRGILEADQRFINGNFDPLYVGTAKTPSCNLDAAQVKKNLRLCMTISERGEDPNPQGRYTWRYQRMLMKASCVDITQDSEELIAQKISKMWKENEDTLICNNTQFDISNGNLIKFAVAMKFDEFLLDVADWKVNFNKVDKTDGRTVLDYVQAHIERNKGHEIEIRLKKYYEMLRKAGAKHRSEL